LVQNPLLAAHPSSRILIIGQASGKATNGGMVRFSLKAGRYAIELKIVLMLATFGMVAPAATATKPAISAYLIRS
jgi:hypothetical protein